MNQQRRRTARVALGAGVVGLLGLGTSLAVVGTAGAAAHATKGGTHAATALTTTQLTFSATVTGLSAVPVTLTGTGAVDFTSDAASLAVTLPASVAKLLPGGSDSPEVVNVVLSGGTLYLEVPSLASLVGEPWISVALPPSAASALSKGFTKAATGLGDVPAIVAFAQKHHGTVTSLGTSIVNGVTATGDQITGTWKGKGGATPSLNASLWADSSSRLVQGNLSVTGAGKTGAAGLSATVNLSGDGAPVTITVPPASEVKPVPFATVARFLGHRGGRRF